MHDIRLIRENPEAFDASLARRGVAPSAQAILALELLALAVSEHPPVNAEDAARRSSDALGARVKAITARFTEA